MRKINFSFTKIDAFTLKNSLIKLEIVQTIQPSSSTSSYTPWRHSSTCVEEYSLATLSQMNI